MSRFVPRFKEFNLSGFVSPFLLLFLPRLGINTFYFPGGGKVLFIFFSQVSL